MTRPILLVLAGAALLALPVPAVGQAQLPEPQPGASCEGPEEGALSRLADGTTVQCGGGRWAVFGGPYPSGGRWVSTDTGLRLHGQGLRNPEMLSGPWTAYPQDPDTACRAEQTAVVRAGEVGEPQVAQGAPGQPLRVDVLPVMFSIELSGHCLWQAG